MPLLKKSKELEGDEKPKAAKPRRRTFLARLKSKDGHNAKSFADIVKCIEKQEKLWTTERLSKATKEDEPKLKKSSQILYDMQILLIEKIGHGTESKDPDVSFEEITKTMQRLKDILHPIAEKLPPEPEDIVDNGPPMEIRPVTPEPQLQSDKSLERSESDSTDTTRTFDLRKSGSGSNSTPDTKKDDKPTVDMKKSPSNDKNLHHLEASSSTSSTSSTTSTSSQNQTDSNSLTNGKKNGVVKSASVGEKLNLKDEDTIDTLTQFVVKLTDAETQYEDKKPFTVYTIDVSDGTTNVVLKVRFSQLSRFHDELKKEFPNEKFPSFPGKSLFGTMSRNTINKRRNELEVYLQKVLRNPKLSKTAFDGLKQLSLPLQTATKQTTAPTTTVNTIQQNSEEDGETAEIPLPSKEGGLKGEKKDAIVRPFMQLYLWDKNNKSWKEMSYPQVYFVY